MNARMKVHSILTTFIVLLSTHLLLKLSKEILFFENRISGIYFKHESSISHTSTHSGSPSMHRHELSDLPISLSNYAKLHHEKRACLVSQDCDSSSFKMLVWKCPKKCYGLGDRIRGIEFAFLFAIVTNRLFFIEWPADPFPLNATLIPNLINWQLPPSVSSTKWGKLDWYHCVTGHPCNRKHSIPFDELLPDPSLNKSFNLSRDDITNVLEGYDSLVISTRALPISIHKLLRNDYIRTRFKDLAHVENKMNFGIHNTQIQRFLLSSLFLPSKDVETRIEKIFTSEHLQTGYVSIHVRTGLEFGEGQKNRFREFNRLLPIAVDNMFRCALSYRESEHQSVYIAADSIEVKQMFRLAARMKNVPIHTTSRNVFHIERKRKADDTLWEDYLNVFVDFFALARSDAMITNGSGFSLMAFIIGKGRKIVITKPFWVDSLLKCP